MLAMVVITGCATGPRVGRTAYQPSSHNGDGYGYSDVQLNERTFQVTFKATTPTEAREGAMRRAAEVTLGCGADGFLIADGQDQLDPVVRSRFIVGRVKRNVPVTVLTINPLRRSEFSSVSPGSMVYDARMLLQRSN
jgi:hypothetical protein